MNRYLQRARPETWLLILLDALVLAVQVGMVGAITGEMRDRFAANDAARQKQLADQRTYMAVQLKAARDDTTINRAYLNNIAVKLGFAQDELDRLRGDVP